MQQVDPSEVPLNDLQRSIVEAIAEFYGLEPALTGVPITTARDAKEILEKAEKLRHSGQPVLY